MQHRLLTGKHWSVALAIFFVAEARGTNEANCGGDLLKDRVMSEPNIELYRIKKLKEVTGLGSSSIWARLQPTAKQYDPSFPRPISLSATGKGAVAWVSTEVQNWIRRRIELSRASGNRERGVDTGLA